MKVLLSSFHNPHFISSVVYRERAIEQLGHELVFFEDRAFLLPGRIRQRFGLLQQWDLKRLNSCLIKTAAREKPDVCLVLGGHRVLGETIRTIQKLGCAMMLWTTDVPIEFEHIARCAPLYDHVFCAGTEALDIFKSQKLHNAIWVPYACDPLYHQPVTLTREEQKEFGRDVVFVGSFYPNRARLLESISDLTVGVWGPYWSRLEAQSPLRKKAMDVKLNYDTWVKIYNAAKVVLVIHYQDEHVPCHQASPKLFEAMACRSFVLSDAQKDARALFQEGTHLSFFEKDGDLKEKIMYYLRNAEERLRIAAAGYEEVLTKHTYQNRLKDMLAHVTSKV